MEEIKNPPVLQYTVFDLLPSVFLVLVIERKWQEEGEEIKVNLVYHEYSLAWKCRKYDAAKDDLPTLLIYVNSESELFIEGSWQVGLGYILLPHAHVSLLMGTIKLHVDNIISIKCKYEILIMVISCRLFLLYANPSNRSRYIYVWIDLWGLFLAYMYRSKSSNMKLR